MRGAFQARSSRVLNMRTSHHLETCLGYCGLRPTHFQQRRIDELLEEASAEERKPILRTLLKQLDDQINGLQRTRRAVAMRLKGDRVIVNPRDRNRLQDRIEQLILEIDPSDRVHPDEEEKAEAVRRTELALKNGYQCDGDGYINGSGKYVWFDPNEGESEDEP